VLVGTKVRIPIRFAAFGVANILSQPMSSGMGAPSAAHRDAGTGTRPRGQPKSPQCPAWFPAKKAFHVARLDRMPKSPILNNPPVPHARNNVRYAWAMAESLRCGGEAEFRAVLGLPVIPRAPLGPTAVFFAGTGGDHAVSAGIHARNAGYRRG
jgi:hypothetical protein